MVRNSILYRRFRYTKKRHEIGIHIFARIISIFIILTLMNLYAQKNIYPMAVEQSHGKVESIISDAVVSVLNSEFPDGVKYTDFVIISRNNEGSISSIAPDASRTDKLSNKIADVVETRLLQDNNRTTYVPLAVSSGRIFPDGVGPGIGIKFVPSGNVKADFIYDTSAVADSSTKYKLVARVKVQMYLELPLIRKKHEIVKNIPVAEMIIINSDRWT